MNVFSKTLLLTGLLFTSSAFSMENSYDCVRAKMDRVCNPCSTACVPACCDRETVCPSCPKWDDCNLHRHHHHYGHKHSHKHAHKHGHKHSHKHGHKHKHHHAHHCSPCDNAY